ncbi:MAG: hypothetical protein Q7T82_14060 [Armatimonadota bacterium]|nr:hypothetical protein [Armatimonadota bacterium]
MIKINLLPGYVLERQVVRRLMVIFAALLAFVVVAGVAWRIQRGAALANLRVELESAKMTENEVISNETRAKEELAKIDPINGKVKFIEDVMSYNLRGPALYEDLTRFTYEKVRYRNITLTDTQMEIEAYAPSLSDAGRYLLNLYRATDLFSQVSMSEVPAYNAGSGGGSSGTRGGGVVIVRPARVRGFDFKVTCVLAQPLSAPTYGGAAPAAGTPGVIPGATPAPGMPPMRTRGT